MRAGCQVQHEDRLGVGAKSAGIFRARAQNDGLADMRWFRSRAALERLDLANAEDLQVAVEVAQPDCILIPTGSRRLRLLSHPLKNDNMFTD